MSHWQAGLVFSGILMVILQVGLIGWRAGLYDAFNQECQFWGWQGALIETSLPTCYTTSDGKEIRQTLESIRVKP